MKYFYVLVILIGSIVHLCANEVTLEKVRLQLQWKHQFEFAGFYAAKEKGFYKEAGLDVSFIEFNKDTNIVNEVLNERAEYGLGYSSIVLDYMQNKPIVFMANFFKQSPLVLVTQKEITSLSRLKGAKVEGLSNNIDNITLFTMLNKFGITSLDFETTAPTFSIDAFLNKEIDAMSAFTTNELFLLDKAGAEYNIFDPLSYGAKYYDLNLFTSLDELTKNPKRVKKFRDASIKGWEYALKNKEEIIELILNKYNSQKKSKESLEFESFQVESLMLPRVHEVGSIDKEKVKIIAENFMQSRFISLKRRPSFDKFYINDKSDISELTQNEYDYLEEKQLLTICIDPSWMPIEAVIDSKHVGMSADYWGLFQKQLGIPINFLKTSSWSGSLNAMDKGKCDVLSLSAVTPHRDKTIHFTDPFLSLSSVIVTKTDKKNVLEFTLLKDKLIAVVRGYAIVDLLRDKYPYINIVEVENIDEGLKMVTQGTVFGFADSSVAIDYAYSNGSYDDFKINTHFDEKIDLGLGIAHDNIQLFRILQKVVQNITNKQKQDILTKWFSSKYETKTDYKLFIIFIGFILIILLLIVYRHYSVKKLNKELSMRVAHELKNSSEKDKMIFHQSKLVAMGEMMENIAHQWRQPLSQVNSCVLVIDDTLDEHGICNEVIEGKMQEIESLTQYMSNTIDDFRNFFDQHKKKGSIIIEEIIEKTLEVLKGKIELYNIKLIVDFRLAHECYTHFNELQQVFLAILNNAIDVLVLNNIENPSIKIEIKKDEDTLLITLCDNAGGISEEIMEKIFEPYYTTKHKAQGTGLGLYISKVIIEDSLGGRLKVKNNFSGACFIIELNDGKQSQNDDKKGNSYE